MSDLTKLLKERLALNNFADGAIAENARLKPIHNALIECVAALEPFKCDGKGATEYERDAVKALNKLREVLK